MPPMIHVITTPVAVAQLKATCSSVAQLISQAVEPSGALSYVQVQTKASAVAVRVIRAAVYQGGEKVPQAKAQSH